MVREVGNGPDGGGLKPHTTRSRALA